MGEDFSFNKGLKYIQNVCRSIVKCKRQIIALTLSVTLMSRFEPFFWPCSLHTAICLININHMINIYIKDFTMFERLRSPRIFFERNTREEDMHTIKGVKKL